MGDPVDSAVQQVQIRNALRVGSISELRRDNRRYKRLIEKLQKTASQQGHELATLKKRTAKPLRVIKKARQQRGRAIQERNEMRQALKAALDEKSALQEHMYTLQAHIKQLEAQVAEAKK
jgi:chromosome segregation ATPase